MRYLTVKSLSRFRDSPSAKQIRERLSLKRYLKEHHIQVNPSHHLSLLSLSPSLSLSLSPSNANHLHHLYFRYLTTFYYTHLIHKHKNHNDNLTHPSTHPHNIPLLKADRHTLINQAQYQTLTLVDSTLPITLPPLPFPTPYFSTPNNNVTLLTLTNRNIT